MATPSQEQIAKDILLAALEKKAIILPNPPTYREDEEVTEHNKKCAEQIGMFYRIILQTIESASGGDITL